MPQSASASALTIAMRGGTAASAVIKTMGAITTCGQNIAGMGVLAVGLAAINVFGAFLVTNPMLEMFRKKDRKVPVVGAGRGE